MTVAKSQEKKPSWLFDGEKGVVRGQKKRAELGLFGNEATIGGEKNLFFGFFRKTIDKLRDNGYNIYRNSMSSLSFLRNFKPVQARCTALKNREQGAVRPRRPALGVSYADLPGKSFILFQKEV